MLDVLGVAELFADADAVRQNDVLESFVRFGIADDAEERGEARAGAEQVQALAGPQRVQDERAGWFIADEDFVARLEVLQSRGEGAVGDLDAVKLEVLLVVRAGQAVGAQQRPAFHFQADHHAVAVFEAQAAVAGGGEAAERVGPVADTQHGFAVDLAHPASLARTIRSVKRVIQDIIIGNADMRYTLRQLEVFSAVARAESVSRAAEALFMSQSAVSGALADLERQFDVRLFERVGKRLVLSELGRALWPQAEAVCEQARALEHNLSRQASGELRVG